MLLGDYRGRLCLADWPGHSATGRVCRMLGTSVRPGRSALLDEATARLDAWFDCGRDDFGGLPLLPVGTEFQLAVWAGLLRVPYGATVTYGALARRIGRPEAVRAVASAVGANALSVVIPCHRVVAATGLGGYAGGLAAKKIMLNIEQTALC